MVKVIDELKGVNKKFPYEAIDECVENKSEIAEILLDEIDILIKNPEIMYDDEDYMFHFYAIFLLAQFREKRAFKKIIDLFSLDADDVDISFGDVITEDLDSILYSTFDGNIRLLEDLIENPSIFQYVRSSALDTYTKLYFDGLISKGNFINYLKDLLYNYKYNHVYDLATIVQDVVIDAHLFEMIDDIQDMYDMDRIDLQMNGEFDSFIDSIYSYEYNHNRTKYIEDVAKEMETWPCFEQTEKNKEAKKKRLDEIEKFMANHMEKVNETFNNSKKIGRNDPCPCGSGKKFKKCCLGKKISDMDFIEPTEERNKALEYYPITSGKRKENEIRITDFYDDESIEIDRLVYLAVHQREIPIWIHVNEVKANKVRIYYLVKAYKKFIKKYENENIKSLDEYDNKYKIHYRSKYWLEFLNYLIEEYHYGDEDGEILKTLKEILKE